MTKWTAARIKELRRKFRESQGEFCKRLNVTVDTVRVWEQGRGEPSGPAQFLLDRVEQDLKALKSKPQPAEA